jgi:hypothetical protein
MESYNVKIVDDQGETLYVAHFDADDAEHAREQAEDHIRGVEGENVGLVLPA